MPRMSLRRHLLIYLPLCLGLAVLSSCGYNPKSTGGGAGSDLGFTGTIECFWSGCHEAVTFTLGAYPGFRPVDSWATGDHANTNAMPSTTSGTAQECSSCHLPIERDGNDAAFLFTPSSPLGSIDRPISGCESCHGTGMEHYAYGDTVYAGDHFSPLLSTLWTPLFGNPFNLTACGPCHTSDIHTGGSVASDRLTNQDNEFKDSGHFSTFFALTDQGLMTSQVRGIPCTACHTSEGFVRFYAYDDTAWANSPVEVDRIVDDTASKLSQVPCAACHPSHEPGNIIRAPFTSETLCVQCHNVRGLKADVGSGFSGTGALEIPRNPQREIFEGVKNAGNDSLRGLEFTGYTFGDGSHAGTDNVPQACVGCHFVEVTDVDVNEFPEKATTGHTFQARLERCLTSFGLGGCHQDTDFLMSDGSSFSYSDTTIASFDFGSIMYSGPAYSPLYSDNDYDMNGVEEAFQTEIQGMLENLKGAITSQPGYTSEMFLDDQGLFDMNAMASMNNTVRGAAYNYDYITEDRSLGYHNPLYVIDLLNASIDVLP
ncbi:hypothetical protein EP232_02720 [bacterium]|nr:MAG: hypothetical protein EP232_02720 [bacterium]